MTYQGVVHIHSTHSYDGKLSLAELKAFLCERTINFACVTEHTDQMSSDQAAAFVHECRALSDDTFVFVPGFEVPYKKAHILMIGCTEWFGQTATSREDLHAWSTASTLTILAHPVRNHYVVDEDLLSVLDGVEIWNQQYDGKQLPRTKAAALLTQLRTDRPELLSVGGLDFHRREHFGTPLITLELSRLDEVHILETLAEGNYSFGTEELLIDADADWVPTAKERFLSTVSTTTIASGKWVNKLLASAGLSLPRSLTRHVRSRV